MTRRIFAEFCRNEFMIDADNTRESMYGALTRVVAGRYELEQISAPFGRGTWLVLKGTKIGGGELDFWKRWASGEPIVLTNHPDTCLVLAKDVSQRVRLHREGTIFATLVRDWEMCEAFIERDRYASRKAIIPKGRHELERIPNPLGYPGTWLVLKGTMIGGGENSWKQWQDHTDECQVTIEDETAVTP